MLRKALLPSILLLLGYGLWLSASFSAIASGVAVFLFGMLAMEEGFKALTGGVLDRMLKRTTNKLWKSLTFGVVCTTVMQSSSLVSVIAISFLGAGMISLTAGIGIIFGANLGTTTGAWLVAGFGLKVNIAQLAMPMLVFGIVLVLQQIRSLRGLGYVLAGLGFIFLGIHFMKEGFDSFKDQVDLASYAMPGLKGLLVYAGLGVLATVIMQSSHATLVLTITALSTGQLSYENALALAIGSNVGTTITAIIGSLSANVDGKRLAGAHLVFNLVTGLVAIALIAELVIAVAHIAGWLGISQDNHTLKLAIFHTLFNVLGVALILPFTSWLERALLRVLPDLPSKIVRPLYLNDAALEVPDASVEAARRETLHLLDNGYEIVAHGLGLHRREIDSDEWLGDIVARRNHPLLMNVDARYEQAIKPVFSALVDFVSRADVPATASSSLFALRDASRNIVEAVKGIKHLNKNLVRYLANDNEDVRAQYNLIRIQLGKVLRALSAVRREDLDDGLSTLALDEVKLELRELDERMVEQLAVLVRDRRVPAYVVTSIMNDAHYALNIVMRLLDAAQTLSAISDKDQQHALDEIALDDTDVRNLEFPTKESSSP